MSFLFQPIAAGGKQISVTATSSSTALSTSGNPDAVRVTNDGSSEMFVRVASGSQTAVVNTDMILRGGDTAFIPIDRNISDYEIGAICSATESTTAYAIVGFIHKT